MKLRTKIFLTFSILATVPLVIFTAFCYKRYTETTYERMNVISSHLFENAQNAVNDTLTKVRQTAGTFNFYYNDGSSIISDLKNFKDSDSPPDTSGCPRHSNAPARIFCILIRTFMASISLLHPVIFLTVQMAKMARSSLITTSRMRTGIRIPWNLMAHFT